MTSFRSEKAPLTLCFCPPTWGTSKRQYCWEFFIGKAIVLHGVKTYLFGGDSVLWVRPPHGFLVLVSSYVEGPEKQILAGRSYKCVFFLWKFANIGLNISLRSRVFCIFGPWIIWGLCLCIFVLDHVPLIKQSLFASRFVVIDWGGRDAAARRPWRRARFHYRRSADCPKTDFLSATVWELSPVSANGVVAQRFHMHSRLICGMCEDHLLAETERQLQSESWRCQPSHTHNNLPEIKAVSSTCLRLFYCLKW